MKPAIAQPIATRSMSLLLLAGCLTAGAGTALSQTTAAPAITTLTTVEVTQRGIPPSGPFAVVIEHDPGLATHTIYRPKDLGKSRHGVLVWGEGGCAKNGLTFPEYLSEIASYGFVVVADGPPIQRAGGPGPGAGGPGGAGGAGAGRGAAPGAGGPGAGGPGAGAGAGAGGARAAGGAPAGGPGGMGAMTDGTALIKAVDWMEREAASPASRFYKKVDVTNVAAMGMSCGGLMSYGASNDPRIATVGIWNSGLTAPDKKIFDGLHSSVIIVTGGESDIAYGNGKRDFETLPVKIPVFYGTYPSVGHGGTYNEDNGGAFGVAAVAWLKWQLQGDKGDTGRGYFIGKNSGISKDPKWLTQSRALK